VGEFQMLNMILINNRLSPKQRLKNVILYQNRKRGAIKSWKRRHKKVYEQNNDFENPVDKSVEKDHRRLWSGFRRKVDPSTLRICGNMSGSADPRIVPEDIFVSDIEPSLSIDSSVNYLSNKSFYNHWFRANLFPRDLLHNIGGQYLDQDLNEISFDLFKIKCREITYPVVLKPNRDSYGGQGVSFVENSEQLIRLAKEKKDFVVQEKIDQHKFFKEFNHSGLNTFRINIYRSVKTNRLHILSSAIRMGVGGSLDNETAGGISIMIKDDGFMIGYAVDKFGRKYMKHPDTGLTFDKQIPDYEGLKNFSLKIGSQIFLTRIIGLDACCDERGNWRAIEINTKGLTIRSSQYGGQPFFGKFTEEVIEYCTKNHWTLRNSLSENIYL